MTDLTPPTGAPGPARRLDLDRALVAGAVALLAATVLISAVYSRARPALDGSTYLAGVLATAGLLGVAVLAARGSRLIPAGPTADVAAWPGAFGAGAAGLMVGVGLDDRAGTTYVAGLVVLLLSLYGWLLTWRDPFVVSAVGGLFVVAAEGFDDLVGVDGDERLWPAALGLVVFAVGVTVAGWLAPARVANGVTAGAIAVAGLALLTGTLAIEGSLRAALQIRIVGGATDPDVDEPWRDINADTWITLLLALALVVFWVACAAASGALGFRILAVATAVSVAPLATIALQVEHPSRWCVLLGVAGGATLLAALRPGPSADDAAQASGT